MTIKGRLHSCNTKGRFLSSTTVVKDFQAKIEIIIIIIIIRHSSAIRLLNDLGRRISLISGDTRETSHLYQRVSVLVQRFNAVLLHDSLPVTDCTD